jgi:hypothetical protein
MIDDPDIWRAADLLVRPMGRHTDGAVQRALLKRAIAIA